MTSPNLAPIVGGLISPDFLRALAERDRRTLESFVTAAIDMLDEIDPDPDFEPEEDGACDEDEISTGFHALRNMPGPGYPISDEDSAEEYRPLWQTREGREFANARRASLGIPPIERRR